MLRGGAKDFRGASGGFPDPGLRKLRHTLGNGDQNRVLLERACNACSYVRREDGEGRSTARMCEGDDPAHADRGSSRQALVTARLRGVAASRHGSRGGPCGLHAGLGRRTNAGSPSRPCSTGPLRRTSRRSSRTRPARTGRGGCRPSSGASSRCTSGAGIPVVAVRDARPTRSRHRAATAPAELRTTRSTLGKGDCTHADQM
jgi:hypothetical protein